MRKIKIQSNGVMRCCLASVGGDNLEDGNWSAFDNPENGMIDNCEYCNREFTLVDDCWVPTEWIDT